MSRKNYIFSQKWFKQFRSKVKSKQGIMTFVNEKDEYFIHCEVDAKANDHYFLSGYIAGLEEKENAK